MSPQDEKIQETGIAPALRVTVVAGAVAGDVTVTGIEPEDRLVSVLEYDPDSGSAGVGGLADLSSEFDISDDDTINNGGGTDTSGHDLIVIYHKHATQ